MESLEQPGAFDNGLKAHPETTAFFHAASSVIMNFTDQEKETLLPAVEGTKNALHDVHYHGQRETLCVDVVVHCQCQFFRTTKHRYRRISERFEVGSAIANPSFAYPVSKTYAKKAAWDFVEKEEEQISLTTANPAYVLFS